VVKYGKQANGTQRYRCHNPDCSRRIFLLQYHDTGRLPEIKQRIVDKARQSFLYLSAELSRLTLETSPRTAAVAAEAVCWRRMPGKANVHIRRVTPTDKVKLIPHQCKQCSDALCRGPHAQRLWCA